MIAVVDHRAFDKAITPALVAITVINLLKIKNSDLDHTIDSGSHFLQDLSLNCHRKTASKIQGAGTNIFDAFSLCLYCHFIITFSKLLPYSYFGIPFNHLVKESLVSDPEWKSRSKYCIPFIGDFTVTNSQWKSEEKQVNSKQFSNLPLRYGPFISQRILHLILGAFQRKIASINE